MRFHFQLLICLMLALLNAPALLAKEAAPVKLPPGIVQVTSVEGITEYRLTNGLRVLLFPDASKPTVTVNVTYLVGTRHENYGETGMAHLLEHLVFKGTPKIPQLDREFNKRGMRSNGTTWLDRTNYFQLFQASDENLKWAIEMEADRMVNAFIAKKDLDSEMTVVRNEYERGENQPFQVLLKRMQSLAYDWHNYGNSSIGNRSDIENVDIKNLQAFYRTYYQPDNAVLLVAGKFEAAKALEWIANSFGKLPQPKRVLPKLWTVEPTQDGERQFFVRRKGDIQIIAVGYKIPSGLHPDADAIGFANFVLGDTPTGRLHKALVETGKAAQVVAFPLWGLDTSLQFFAAVVKKGEPIEPVRDELVRMVEVFHASPVSAEEMGRMRNNTIKQFEEILNNHETLGVQMSEYIALGDWRLFFHARDQLDKVTPEQVTEVAKRYYQRDNRTVGIFQPEDAPKRAEIPPAPSVAALLKDFKPKQAEQAAEVFDPSPANIDKRTKIIQIDGLKVALLNKRNRGGTVNFTLRLHAGDEKSLFGKNELGQMVGSMLMRGTNRLSRTQIADETDKLKMSGAVFGLGANFQTTRPNLPAAIKLAAHLLRDSNFPESEFEQLKKQALTTIEAQKTEPGPRANEAIGLHFNLYPKGDPRYASSFEETIAGISQVKYADLAAFHAEFYGAGKGELAIVGDFEEAEVVKAITEAFGGWRAKAAYTRIALEHKPVAPVNRSVATPDKENAVIVARMNLNLRDDDPEFPALYLADYLIGGEADLDARRSQRLRQKDGLTYGVRSQLSVGSIDRAGAWSVSASAAPQNIAKVEAALIEEINKVLKEGFTAAEVAGGKSGALQKAQQARAQDAALAGRLARNLFVGRTLAWSKAFEDKLAALKPEDLQAAVRKHIDPAKLTIIKAGDFTKVK